MVRLKVGERSFQEIEVMETGLSFAILGRDWLESYYVQLNGPEHSFQISVNRFVDQPQ